MIESFVECYLQGKNFDPFQAEKKLGLNFSNKVKKGDLGIKGRFKGQPYPFGFCYLKPDIDSNDENDKLKILLEMIEKSDIKIGNYKIEEIHIRMDINYDSQCNLEFDPIVLEEFGKNKIPLLISCYKVG